MRIMTISDSPTLFSGLARVHRHMIEGFLAAGHEVTVCGWFAYDSAELRRIQKGEKLPPKTIRIADKDVEVLCVPKKNGTNSMFAAHDVVCEVRPDVVVTSGDYWDFWYMPALKSRSNFSFKWLAYLTVEHDEVSDKWAQLFRNMDAIAVPTSYGQRALRGVAECPISVVPYGVEPAFAPSADRAALRAARGCDGKVRFITVAQNTWRKAIPTLVQAVSLIAHRDPGNEMEFYVHTNLTAGDKQEASLYDLRQIAEKLGVLEWFRFPGEDVSLFDAPPDQALAEEYNSSDVFVLPSTCEGFCLPMVEAMACGVPAICNSASCAAEHVGAREGMSHGKCDRGFVVNNRLEVWPPATLLRMVRPDSLAQAVWEMTLMARDGGLADMRPACLSYAKEKTWGRMKDNLCDITGSLGGPTKIPIEVL